MHVYKVIIVGAGAAGIAAAKFLSENGVDFMVLEAQDYIGGRIKTQVFGKKPDGSSSLVELGAQWIHGEENDFFKFIKAGGFIHEETSWEGQGEFITPDGNRISTEKVQKIVDWVNDQLDSLEDEPGVAENNGRSNDEVHSESVGEYLKRKFEEYLQENDDLPEELQMAIFQWANSYHRIDNCCNQMTDLSKHRWADFEVNGGELYNNFLSGGSQALSKLSETFLTSSNVRLGRQVKRLNWETEEIQVFVNDSEFYLCHSIIITCSIGVLKESPAMFSPPLPQVMSEAINKTGFGPLTKIFLEWEQPWWPSKGFEGYQLLWPQDFLNCCDDICDGSDEEKIKVAERWYKSITGFDPVLDSPNVLLGWLGGPEAVYVETLDETVVGVKCAEILSQFTGIQVPSPKAVVVSKWTLNPHVRGAYCYRSAEGDSLGEGIISTLQQPVFNSDDNGVWKPALIFAGEALHKSQYSTLHGAFASGAEQAEKLLQLIQHWEKQRSDSK